MDNITKRKYKNEIFMTFLTALNDVFKTYVNNDFKKSKEFCHKVVDYKIFSDITLYEFNYVSKKETVKRIIICVDIKETKTDDVIFHWQYCIEDNETDRELAEILSLEVLNAYNKGFEKYEEVVPLLKKVFKGKFAKLNKFIQMIIDDYKKRELEINNSL